MPNSKLYKFQGEKIIPINRFNLAPAKPSISFNAIPNNFAVIQHPVVSSISFKEKRLEHFPFIERNKKITKKSIFKENGNPNVSLRFPEIELFPDNDTIFYYENILGKNAEVNEYYGKVTLRYRIKNDLKKSKFKFVNINLREAILNLKVAGNEVIKIYGIVNVKTRTIMFELKDEAVKIAFNNLTSKIDALRPDISLFFDFKGYSRPLINAYLAVGIATSPILNLAKAKITNVNILNTVKNNKVNFKSHFLTLKAPLVFSTKK